MNRFIPALLFLLIVSLSTSAQSIRKDYREMTQSERGALVNALYQQDALISDMATFHNINFNSLHMQSSQSRDIFLAWHRRLVFELEQAVQQGNPRLSIPYWDWTTDNSINSSLWTDLLYSFNSNWNLRRTLGQRGQLPTSSQVDYALAATNWWDFTMNRVEMATVHNGPHNWIGGAMSEGISPRDPAFYLHHGMIDKMWQEWVEANNITPSSNLYTPTSMPRYNGSYRFNNQTLPSVDPDQIVDSRALGVFFAKNQLAQLTKYTVSNTYKSREHFYYQYTIEAKDNFIVPSGKSATIESVNSVVLKPGFHAQSGSSFVAKIDNDTNVNTEQSINFAKTTKNQDPFVGLTILQNAYQTRALLDESRVVLYPNPVENSLKVGLGNFIDECKIEIFNLQGVKVYSKELSNVYEQELDLTGLSSGLYIISIKQANNTVITKKFIKS